MKLIALLGLVTVEKLQLVVQMADYYTRYTGQTVSIIDNMIGLTVDPVYLNDELLFYFEDQNHTGSRR